MQLPLWQNFGLWQRVFTYYCESNEYEDKLREDTEKKTTVLNSMMGFFKKPSKDDKHRFSEEILRKSFHDVQDLMFQMGFPFELISTTSLKFAKE